MEDDLNDQMKRLYEVARACGIETTSKLAAALNVSQQTVTNWGIRESGIAREGLLAAEEVFGVSALWLVTGKGAPDLSALKPVPPPAAEDGYVSASDLTQLVRIFAECNDLGRDQILRFAQGVVEESKVTRRNGSTSDKRKRR